MNKDDEKVRQLLRDLGEVKEKFIDEADTQVVQNVKSQKISWTFRKRFCAPYLLETSMGWSENRAKMYFNSTTHYYYNKVSQIDLDMITRMAELAARDLERIRLVKDEEMGN